VKALITGVRGFCGSHLVRRLRQEQNVEVAGLDTAAAPLENMSLERYFQGDVRDSEAMAIAVRSFRPDWLFHLAGASALAGSEALIYEVNVTGTVHILEAVAVNAPDCSVLVLGSAAEYGPVEASALPIEEDAVCRPKGPYGISKYAATLASLDYSNRRGLKVVVARPFNIVGPGIPPTLVVGALIARAKRALLASDPVVKIGDMESERDFVAASDAADAYVRLLQGRFSGEIFNICSGRAYSIRHVAESLLANAPRHITLEVDPNLVSHSPIRCIYGSRKKAERAIGFQPTMSLEEILKEVWNSEIGIGSACASPS
jgi:GDP-4-dehydro-6-deoxy-D-mannose reductase